MKLISGVLLITFVLFELLALTAEALPHRRSLPQGNTQNIYGLKLRRNDFNKSSMYGLPNRGLRKNYFGPELQRHRDYDQNSAADSRYTYNIPRDAPANWGFTAHEYGNGQVWQEWDGDNNQYYDPNLVPPFARSRN